MSAQEYSVLNLYNLPEDVIRKIIAIGINSIDDVKLVNYDQLVDLRITPRWNLLAQELLENRIRCPKIKRLNYAFYPGQLLGIAIVLPSTYRKYFGMLNKRRTKNSANFWTHFEDSEDSFVLNVETDKLLRGEESEFDYLRRVVDRSSSVELLSIEMTNSIGGMYIMPIKLVTGPLKIDELRLTGQCLNCVASSSTDSCSEIIIGHFSDEIVDFVQYYTVRLLSLSIFEIKFVKESEQFFIKIASVVSVIKFVDLVPFETNEEKTLARAVWNEAKDWLNETGKVTAKLEEGPLDGHYNAKMCITVERKTDT